ncbi:MAG: PD-(D/E)XK nuclease family protein [Bacteroidetes bacterium]|nr:PD-(D/E)XK nuclease family protein [Bacteroidota bacterium]
MKEKYLSASRIKTLETCSWVYWCRYHMGLPDTPNDGALRGSICHLIFELLLKPRHKKHFDAMMKTSTMEGSPAIVRMVNSYLKKHGIEKDRPDDNYEMISEMVMVGLHIDFFGGEGASIDKPEQEFSIENKNPAYKIRGYIDKPIKYEKDGTVKIIDYKSSKYKFRGDELDSNIQALMYSLASKTLWPGMKPKVEFQFLRFPKKPCQNLEFSDHEIKGFEQYLAQVNKHINSFSEKDSTTNFAQDDKKNRWLCGIGKWVCPLKKSFDYYSLEDKDGKQVKSAFDEDDLKSIKTKGQKIVKKHYEGCPKFKNSENNDDPFDF